MNVKNAKRNGLMHYKIPQKLKMKAKNAVNRMLDTSENSLKIQNEC